MSENPKESEQPLLSDPEEFLYEPHNFKDQWQQRIHQRYQKSFVLYASVLLNVILLLTGAFMVFPLLRDAVGLKYDRASAPVSGLNFVPTLWSIYDGKISYKIETLNHHSWNPTLFFGPPTNESEFAWQDLLGGRGFRMSPEEAQKLQINDSVKIHPGEEYATLMGVTHNLHCLRRVHQTMYSDHYYPNADPGFEERDREHNQHCLEAIRQSMMCYPDLNPHPYFWSHNPDHDLAVDPKVTRQCVNWDGLWPELNRRVYYYNDLMPGTGPEI